MVLTGIEIHLSDNYGRHRIRVTRGSYEDYKKAAKAVRDSNGVGAAFSWIVKFAELHDTDTERTWSVNNYGVSQKDYRRENTGYFLTRWDYQEIDIDDIFDKRWRYGVIKQNLIGG